MNLPLPNVGYNMINLVCLDQAKSLVASIVATLPEPFLLFRTGDETMLSTTSN